MRSFFILNSLISNQTFGKSIVEHLDNWDKTRLSPIEKVNGKKMNSRIKKVLF